MTMEKKSRYKLIAGKKAHIKKTKENKMRYKLVPEKKKALSHLFSISLQQSLPIKRVTEK
jgi:hypothetical protein